MNSWEIPLMRMHWLWMQHVYRFATPARLGRSVWSGLVWTVCRSLCRVWIRWVVVASLAHNTWRLLCVKVPFFMNAASHEDDSRFCGISFEASKHLRICSISVSFTVKPNSVMLAILLLPQRPKKLFPFFPIVEEIVVLATWNIWRRRFLLPVLLFYWIFQYSCGSTAYEILIFSVHTQRNWW